MNELKINKSEFIISILRSSSLHSIRKFFCDQFYSNFLKQPRNSILLLSQFSFLLKDIFPDSENKKLCTMLTRSFIFRVKYFRVPYRTNRRLESFQAKWGRKDQNLCPEWRTQEISKVFPLTLNISSPAETYSLHLRDLGFKAMVVELYCLTELYFPLSKHSTLGSLGQVPGNYFVNHFTLMILILVIYRPHFQKHLLSVCIHMYVCVCVLMHMCKM